MPTKVIFLSKTSKKDTSSASILICRCRTVAANKRVIDDKGKVAVERGGLVYCAEAADNQGEAVLRVIMNPKEQFSLIENYSIENKEAQGAAPFTVNAIRTNAQILKENGGKVEVKGLNLTLIPYYAWNHRGSNQMNVWFVKDLTALDK